MKRKRKAFNTTERYYAILQAAETLFGEKGYQRVTIEEIARAAGVAKGLVNYKASDIKKLMGLKTDQIEQRLGYKHYDEVIHRDNLVMTVEETGGPACR